MFEKSTYANLPLELLKKLRDSKRDSIERDRRDIAEIEFAIKHIERPYDDGLSVQERDELLMSGGSLRNIPQWVIKVLRANKMPMTATEIADALYSYSWSLPIHQFRRRIVVSVSAIHMLPPDDPNRTIIGVGLKPGTREKMWALPEWPVTTVAQPVEGFEFDFEKVEEEQKQGAA